MEGARNGGGLPRHSFIDEPFFRNSQAADKAFRDFDSPLGRERTFGGSNPRVFDNDFFDNFAKSGSGFGADPSFFRSSLPRRYQGPINEDRGNFERPIHIQRPTTTPQHSPAQQRKTQFFTDQPQPKFHHHRQSSAGNYDNYAPLNSNSFYTQTQPHPYSQPQTQPHQQHPQQYQQHQPSPNRKGPENVHVIHVQHQQPQNIVEINNANPSSYTNGQLNPDRKRDISGTRDASSSPPKIPVFNVEDFTNRNSDEIKSVGDSIPAISEKPIPLPPPESLSFSPNSKPVEYETATKSNNHPQESNCNNSSATSISQEVKKLDVSEGKSDNDNRDKPEKPVGFVPMAGCGEELISLLDKTERRVEQLRETANQLEQEKESILDILHNVKLNADVLQLGWSEQDELNLTTERLLKRCKAVDVVVNTPRNEEQTRALAEVNRLIDSIVQKMQDDLNASKETMCRFLNACSPDEPSGPIDQRFQAKIVECTADDQKKVRCRLTQILTQIERAERNCQPVK